MSTTQTVTRDQVKGIRDVEERVHEVMAVEDGVLGPVMVALLAQGHILIEGIPGIGKTLLARTLARTLSLDFHRIQFTNDLMPSDIVGSSIWRPDVGQFEFVRGPLFANLVLADEVNRTSPRTLSCLLEAMERGRVSIDGREHTLAEPFLVLATRNPIEFHGTYPVPEAALDRFLVRVTLEYPETEREMALYLGDDPDEKLRRIEPVLTRDDLMEMGRQVRAVQVSEPVAAYCYRVVAETRRHDAVALGASPRAALSWLHAARAYAYLDGRDYVLPDDLKALAGPVLSHRIFLHGGGDATDLVAATLESSPVDL